MTHDFLIRFKDGTSKLFPDTRMYIVNDEHRIISAVSEKTSQLLFFDDVASIEIVKANKTIKGDNNEF